MDIILNINIEGKNFIPISWENSPITTKIKVSKYTDAKRQWITLDTAIVKENQIEAFISIIYNRLEDLKNSNFTGIELWILVVRANTQEQCNLHVNKKAIQMLAELNGTINIEYLDAE